MRGRGLGRKLLNNALSWCRAQNADAVILWATAESKSLYRQCGLLEPADILELRGDALRRSN
jgi:GNAT superfamily N-acetyltransferase